MTAASQSPAIRAEAAQRKLVAARTRFRGDVAPLRASFERRRAAWIVGGGLASGLALGFLSPRLLSRVGAVIGGTVGIVARSLLAPMLASAFAARETADASTAQPDT